jgi:hypothetical protein
MYESFMALPQILMWEVPLDLQGPLRDLPTKALKFLSKYNGEGNKIAFEHIRKY